MVNESPGCNPGLLWCGGLGAEVMRSTGDEDTVITPGGGVKGQGVPGVMNLDHVDETVLGVA